MDREADFKRRHRDEREPVRILLVEDDPVFAELLRAQLRRMPWVESRLEVAGTLADAVAKLAGGSFGLVITDLNLPDSAGLTTVDELSRAGAQMIIVLTGDQRPELRAAAMENGAYDFLSKDQLNAVALERLVRLASIQANTYRSLRDSESRFRSLVELSSDWYWEQDEDLRFTRFEGGAADAWGNRPDHAIGKHRWEIATIAAVSSTWEEHRALLEARKPFRNFEYSRMGDDGELRYLSASGEPYFDHDGRFRGYRGIATDITTRKRAEEDLRRFRLAMDNSADMIVLVDRATMQFVDLNNTICKLLGYTRDELLAMGPEGVLPVPREQMEQSYDRLIADPSAPSGMISHYRCKDGSLLPFESTRHVLRSGDRWIIAAISRDIRERIRAEEALHEIESRFRDTFELAGSGMAHVSLDGRFLRVNRKLCEMLGYTAQELVGRSVKETSHPDDRDVTDAQRARLRTGDVESVHFEKRYVRKDGGIVWFDLTVAVARDANNAPAYEISILEDATERKRNEKKAQQLSRMYVALGEVNEAILRAKSPQEVFERACEIAVEAGGFLICTVYLLDGETKRLARTAASGSAAALVEYIAPTMDPSQPGGTGLIGLTCRTGRPSVSNDYVSDPRTVGRRERVQTYEVGSAAVFPLQIEGELAGVFALQHAEANAFSDELNGLLQRLVDNISFALDRFRFDARRRRTKRKLRESEERFRSLTDLSSDMYWEQDDQYRFTAASGTSPTWLDAGRKGMVGRRRWDQRYFNMTEADWVAHRADLDARKPFRDLDLGRINEMGEQVWVSVSGEPVHDDAGVFKGYRGVGKDVTARKREERRIALEHAVTRCLADAESASDALRGVIRTICESENWEAGRYFHQDEVAGVMRYREGWGRSATPLAVFQDRSRALEFAPGVGLVGHAWSTGEPLWVADVANDPRVAQAALAREAGVHGAFVFPVSFEDRTIGVLSISSRTVRAPDAELLQTLRVIGSQVGQFLKRKDTEQGLRESEARFRSLTNLSSDWYWEQDTEFRFVKFEGQGSGEGGYAPASAVLGKRIWELAGLDRESADWEAHRAQLGRHEVFRDFEYSYHDRTGNHFYVSVDGEPVFSQDGKFRGYRGTSRDITQQRRGEQELRRFRAAMDMSADSIFLVDRASMRIVDVNESACRGVGYSREQLLSMAPHDLLRVPRHDLEIEYDAVIAAGEEGVRSETTYVAGDGRRGWTELNRRALRQGDGWIIVTVSRDVSGRKRGEERKAVHLRYQEKIARLGQSALAKRDPAELISAAAQAVLEGLGADAVGYLEPGPGERELVLRALVGVADAPADSRAMVCGAGDPIVQALSSGVSMTADGNDLQPAWAHGLRSVGLVPLRGEKGSRGVLCACYRLANALAEEELNFLEAAASVLSAGLQRIDSEGRLSYLAQFDPLTGLPNRALLADRFSQAIAQARRHGTQLGALFIDLDEFKQVNDTLGHAGGDALLKEVAVRLQSCVRTGDTVARISGDEFAVVLADLARPDDAALVAQKIIDQLAAAFDIHGQEVLVTASVGIAVFPGDGDNAEALLGAADAAMYRAKQAGRNSYQFFTVEIHQRSRARSQMGVDLRHALEREEFSLAYQPKYRLTDRRPCGGEALLRWNHTERGNVPPVEFIPVLEEIGLILQVGEWVLGRVCADIKAWQAAGLPPMPIAVNLSARQFRLQDLDARIREVVRAAGVDPALLELEITESQLMSNPDQAIRMMRALREAGLRLAIDDFGTGYSSLAYLTRFPVSTLKIDRSFIKDMFEDRGDATIVRTVIEMAHMLDFIVVAEGVETEEQARFLTLMRCDQAQGYLFARPMPTAEFSALITREGRALPWSSDAPASPSAISGSSEPSTGRTS